MKIEIEYSDCEYVGSSKEFEPNTWYKVVHRKDGRFFKQLNKAKTAENKKAEIYHVGDWIEITKDEFDRHIKRP